MLALARLARLGRVLKASGGRLKRLGNQLGRVGLVTGAIMVTCAYVGYGAEHAVNKDFATYGDALWWAIVTITTVGYGDIVPITTAGRLSGVALMLAGVAVLGVLAGTLASFFGFGQGQPARKHGEAALGLRSGGHGCRDRGEGRCAGGGRPCRCRWRRRGRCRCRGAAGPLGRR